jgi:hypothetical protein
MTLGLKWSSFLFRFFFGIKKAGTEDPTLRFFASRAVLKGGTRRKETQGHALIKLL